MLPLEPLRHIIGIEADTLSVSPHESTAENAARPAGNIVRFETLEQSDGYFGGLGDGSERKATALALTPQIGAKRGRFVHQLPRIEIVRKVQGEYEPLSGQAQAEHCVTATITCGGTANSVDMGRPDETGTDDPGGRPRGFIVDRP